MPTDEQPSALSFRTYLLFFALLIASTLATFFVSSMWSLAIVGVLVAAGLTAIS